MALVKAFAQQLAVIWLDVADLHACFRSEGSQRLFVLEVGASAWCGSRFICFLNWSSTEALGVYGKRAVETTNGGSLALEWEDWFFFFILLLTCAMTEFIFLSFRYLLCLQHPAECVLLCPLKTSELCSSWSCSALGNIHILMLVPEGCTCARPHCLKGRQNIPSTRLHLYMSEWWCLLYQSESNFLIPGLLCGVAWRLDAWAKGYTYSLSHCLCLLFAVFLALHCKSKPNKALIWMISHLLSRPRLRLQGPCWGTPLHSCSALDASAAGLLTNPVIH